jgi:hypothetical protein
MDESAIDRSLAGAPQYLKMEDKNEFVATLDTP